MNKKNGGQLRKKLYKYLKQTVTASEKIDHREERLERKLERHNTESA